MRRRSWLLPVVVGVLLVSGCTGLPESGPVVDVNVSSSVDDERPNDVNPAPPAEGASATEIAKGFLDAMTASPIRTDVARQFLTTSAQGEWDPDASTITYSGNLLPRDEGSRVTVQLSDADRLDRSGAWQGRLAPEEQVLAFDLTFEGGEYRITNPPDALVVPASWFAQRFRQTSLFFFDPSARILVPQPVFVPRGEQLASALISSLLAGPGEGLQGVARSFVPPGLSVQVSVPVSGDGVADIVLLGDPGAPTPVATDRMLAQLAWTLRQEPSIRALRVTLGDEVVRTPDGDDEYAVGEAGVYDPNGASSSDDIFALREGVLARRTGSDFVPVTGALGEGRYALRTAAVRLDAAQAAAVSADGRRLLVAAIGEAPEEGADDVNGGGVDGAVARPLVGTDLLRPAWDFADRVWVVDRTAAGAVVSYVVGGRARRIDVPGVTGRSVSRFLVSRDGTRFAAVVRGADGDELRIGRTEVDDQGALDRISETEDVLRSSGVQVRIMDVAWTSTTTVAILSPVVPAELFEVRTVSIDGAPTSSGPLSTTVDEPVTALVGSPRTGLPTYAVTESGLVDLADEITYDFVDGLVPTSIGYVG